MPASRVEQPRAQRIWYRVKRIPGEGLDWVRVSWQRKALLGLVVALLAAGGVWWASHDSSGDFRAREQRVTVLSGPNNDEPITLDTTLYLPRGVGKARPAPAVLLAHGFGGTKNSVAADAKRLARDGYVVLAWTARGFGDSDGEVHLDNPDYEVNDAKRLVDLLAGRSDVIHDSADDPRVAVVGASYGGALALMLAGSDKRIDAVVPQITWNDLSRALFPEATGKDATEGVFKRAWAGVFFGNNTLRDFRYPLVTSAGVSKADDPECGRLAPEICRLYVETATSGRASTATARLLQRSSPASVIKRITAPTLLLQGTRDTLFDVAEADANARGIAANGTDVQVAWYNGGHDAPPSAVDNRRLRKLTRNWLNHYLGKHGATPKREFSYSRATGVTSSSSGMATTSYSARDYRGLNASPRKLTMTGPAQRIANPPDGTPSAISSLPGLGALSDVGGLTAGISQEINGQHSVFGSAPLRASTTVVGAPEVTVRAASSTGEAVLFAKLYDFGEPSGGLGLNAGGNGKLVAVAPMRLRDLPTDFDQARAVTVRLPGIAHEFLKGHQLRLVLATSDQAYAGPPEPAVYSVGLGTGTGENSTSSILLPGVHATRAAQPDGMWQWVLLGAVGLIAIGVAGTAMVARRRRGRVDQTVDADRADNPLVVQGLGKTYPGGFTAVRDADFSIERGQVVGLLGPNGAGKTTIMRMLLGLIRPSGGEALIFGHRVEPGSAVLSQVGALVEGPGFLPHVSGRRNLRLYWEATGRPTEDARFDDVLEIAALGEAIERKVRTYSHGMKQRLAIAQAMLGMPALLMLDEPTDGLDPPQIAAMRQVLQRYATDGRTVLISSHLLGEVEQTCTHVVVMHQGRTIAAGPVTEVMGENRRLEDAFLELVRRSPYLI